MWFYEKTNSAHVPGREKASAVWISYVLRLHQTWFCPDSTETCGNLNRTDCCQDSAIEHTKLSVSSIKTKELLKNCSTIF